MFLIRVSYLNHIGLLYLQPWKLTCPLFQSPFQNQTLRICIVILSLMSIKIGASYRGLEGRRHQAEDFQGWTQKLIRNTNQVIQDGPQL